MQSYWQGETPGGGLVAQPYKLLLAVLLLPAPAPHCVRCLPSGSLTNEVSWPVDTVKILVVILTTIPWLIFITILSSLPLDDTVVTHVISVGNCGTT